MEALLAADGNQLQDNRDDDNERGVTVETKVEVTKLKLNCSMKRGNSQV